ncbi:MAG: tRNA (N6-isopentenyl adenosine(37)-C2)-methylthiotransferase MiaB [Deltaproteobacteria bacterium]|nr:MAG: tRNA (N6-isopentenyl adenosine(37)-C2)-methylthiotransferase MiaB [Deltaproteobacteria bacterium]
MKQLYIYTIGCQMNVYDSDQFARLLAEDGYEAVDTPDTADLILVNTCTIREKAEEKAFSFLGRTAQMKAKKPDMIVGVTGCVAQQEGERLLKRMPHVDLVLGTDAVGRLPELVRQQEANRSSRVETGLCHEIDEARYPTRIYGKTPVSDFVTIMQGCDNFCTYCVVPYVRGREKSREPKGIIDEIKRRVAAGTREVTLLGQNVNSYGKKEGLPDFSELLWRVSDIDGLERIRFATSHPKDLSDALIAAYRDIEKLCPHIHLPVQSGSDAVLKRMNRHYTRERYIDRIERLRAARPGLAVSSDMIVGFPGETDDDFQMTLDLVKTIGYDGLFAFIYSDRQVAPAARFKKKLPLAVQKERLARLLALQDENTRMRNAAYVGTVQRVLVEGVSKRSQKENRDRPIQWSGRTPHNKVVNFTAAPGADESDLVGQCVRVRIDTAKPHSLSGSRV